ncbi:MAG: alpha/beta hydrolase family protein, partial [Armatimonadetes bacterium]|nr:alpha/beta hydrolase family protein [Armatimonadota bacterium]
EIRLVRVCWLFAPLWLSWAIKPIVAEGSIRSIGSLGQYEQPEQLVTLFKPQPIEEGQFETEAIGGNSNMRVLKLRFPTPLRSGVIENDTVHSLVYIPNSSAKEPVPAVVILHPLGVRDAANERYLARSLASIGIVAATMELPYHMHRAPISMGSGEFIFRTTPENAIKALRQAAMDAMRLIDWLCMQPFVNKSKLGIVGVSLGGIIAALLAGIDERLTVCVNVLGGDIALTIWDSWLTRQFRRSLEKQGVTLDDLHSMLYWINPTTYAAMARGKHILMVMSEYDLFVPRRACIKLWEAFGRPPMIRLYTGHLCAQFSAPALKDAIISFIKMTMFESKSAEEAASKLEQVPIVALKSELMLPVGGNVGAGVAIELCDIDSARRTSIDIHFTTGGIYAAIQWEVSRNLAIGACMRLDKGQKLHPHISCFIIL